LGAEAATRSRPLGQAAWLFDGQRLARRGDVRVTTALNRVIGLPGARVTGISFTSREAIVAVRLRRRRRVCSRCGQLCDATHDTIVSRWRHLDLGPWRCVIECPLRRVKCADCGVRVEAVAWARPGARFTRDFEDVCAYLAQQMAKKPTAGLLRIAWDTVGRIVERVVAERLDRGCPHTQFLGHPPSASCACSSTVVLSYGAGASLAP